MFSPTRSGLSEILQLALPIIMSMASFTVIGFVDTWMVARVGTAEIAAAMPAGVIAYTLTALPLGITQCVSTFAAQALGRGKPDEGSAFAWQGLYLSLVVGVLAFSLWPLAPHFFSLFGHEPDIVDLEVIYFRVRLWGIGFSVAIGALSGFFYGLHKPKVPLVAAVIANIANVIFAYALIFGKFGVPALGLKGAALAMVLSFIVQFAVLLRVFLSQTYATQFATRATWQPLWTRTRQLLHIGWPAGMQMALDILGWGVLIVLMVGQFGRQQLAASNITIQYMTISFMPALGLGQALTALVGRYIGEGKRDLAVQRVYEAVFLAMAYMALMGMIYLLFRFSFVGFFSQDATVIQVGGTLLLCAALLQVFDGMGIVFAAALRGAGDTHWIAGLTITLLVCVFTPLSLGAVVFTNLESLGPWIAGTINVTFFGLGLWWRFSRGKWRDINIFATQKEQRGDPEQTAAVPPPIRAAD
jgi:MATE family multidrug resistance protein